MKIQERLYLVGASQELKQLVSESDLTWEEEESLDFILSCMGIPCNGEIEYIEEVNNNGVCTYLKTYDVIHRGETKKDIFINEGEEGKICRKLYTDLFNENKDSKKEVNLFKAGLRLFFIYMRTARLEIPGYNFTKDPTNFSMIKLSYNSMNENLL